MDKVAPEQILKYSDKIIDRYLPTIDIYYIILITLLSVTEYSRRKKTLHYDFRVRLTIATIPAMIKYLVEKGHLTVDNYINISNDYTNIFPELPIIIDNYLAASKSDLRHPSKINNNKCNIL
ncbi:MAG: hypothetical protein QM487_10715 [Candidatus Marithrix sp.]